MRQSILLVIAAVVITLLAVGGFFYFSKKSSSLMTKPSQMSEQSEINGQLDLNGHIPQGSYIKVMAKKLPSGSFTTVTSDLAAKNGASWTYEKADSGSTYELKAQLIVDNKVADESQSMTVVAPANNVALRINSQEKPANNVPKTSVVSGLINLNGYIPAGSTVSISVEKQGEAAYETVVTGVAAKDGGTWVWPNAETGQTYNVRASLVNSGAEVTVSSPQIITAPATNELLTLNSTAKPPAPSVVSVTGTVNYNGNIPGNATFSLGVRKSGTTTFTNATSGVSVSQNMGWTYANAVPGQSYDIQGYLWSNNQPYSQSQILTVTAPANGEVLTINAQQQPQAPAGGTINVSCGGQQNNLYQATINFNTGNNLQNAQQYQVTIGTNAGGSNVYSSTTSPSNPNGSQSLTTNNIFSKSVNYYAQYAYSTCQGGNCSTFSSTSPSVAFNCQ